MTVAKSYSLQEIADITGTQLVGDGSKIIHSVATLQAATIDQISFITNERYLPFLKTTEAGAIILPSALADSGHTGLISENPYFTFAEVATLFATEQEAEKGVHPSAVVHPQANIAETASIGPNCTIEADVTIGEGVVLKGNCFIGQGSVIAPNTTLMANVTVYHGCKIGKAVIVASGTVIGSDGFGFAEHKGKWHKIPQLGGVVIKDNVEIGANVTIDRGTIEDTVIEEGVKIDNQVQVAHNVIIGAYTVIAGCVGIAGSTKIGKFCMVGGATAIGGHLEITDNVKFSGMSMVTKSIKTPGIYSSGTGLDENKNWRKNIVRFKQLDKVARKVVALEKQIQSVCVEENES